MKTIYISPALRVVMQGQDVVTSSIPNNYHNEYKPGEGLAPERQVIWK